MKNIAILSLFLVCKSLAGGPIILVDNEINTSDTTYKVPLDPNRKSLNTLRVVIKAESHKSKGSVAITNHPLKIISIVFFLDGKELKFDSVKELPILDGSIKDSIEIDLMPQNVISMRFNKISNSPSLYINLKGAVMLIGKQKK